jgi:hypothetical protein
MQLDAFSVVRSQPVVDHVSAIGWDARRPVVAWLPTAELERGAGRRLNAGEAIREVQWNTDLIERITAAKYARGDYVPHENLGHEGVRVIITWAEIHETGEPWCRPPAPGGVWTSSDGRFG